MRRKHSGERGAVREERLQRIGGDLRKRVVRRREHRPRPRVLRAELRAEARGADRSPQRGESLVLRNDLLDASKLRHHHAVDHMHESAIEGDIGGDEARAVDGERGGIDLERLPGQRLEPPAIEQRRTLERLRDHMVLEDRLQRGLALGARQELDLLARKLGERFVGRCEDRELRILRKLELCGLHQTKQRGEVRLRRDRCERVRRRLLGPSRADRADPVDFDRERAFLLVCKRDSNRLDRRRVKRRRIAHALAEAVRDALIEGDLDFRPLADLRLEHALVATRHEPQARRADVALVRAAVALHAHDEPRRSRVGALGDRRADLRETAVVLERKFTREAQRAALARRDAPGRAAAHHAVEDGLPALGAAVELEVGRGLRFGLRFGLRVGLRLRSRRACGADENGGEKRNE